MATRCTCAWCGAVIDHPIIVRIVGGFRRRFDSLACYKAWLGPIVRPDDE